MTARKQGQDGIFECLYRDAGKFKTRSLVRRPALAVIDVLVKEGKVTSKGAAKGGCLCPEKGNGPRHL